MRINIILCYVVLLQLINGISCAGGAEQNDQLHATVLKVLEAFENKDSVALNRLISEDAGVVVLFRIGVFDEIQRVKTLRFDQPVPAYFPYPEISNNYSLRYDSLPRFNCDSMVWNREGLYCDTSASDDILSRTAEALIKYRGDNISRSDIRDYKKIENSSYRVVLADNTSGDLVFYLRFHKGKWYLSIIDRISTDCSA